MTGDKTGPARCAELAEAVRRAVQDSHVIVRGPAGSGKSRLLSEVVALGDFARRPRLHVHAQSGDHALAYAGVAGLLGCVDRELLDTLPAPQRTVAARILRQQGLPHEIPDHLAVRLAVESLLRELARQDAVLLVVDDAQWLDTSSVDAIGYATRRLSSAQLRLLVAERFGGKASVGERLCSGTPAEVCVPPLTLGEIEELLTAHGLPSRLAGPVYEASGGNPALALGVARGLRAAGVGPSAIGAIELPGGARHLVNCWLEGLPDQVRRVLLLAALTERPTVGLLRQAAGRDVDGDLASAGFSGLVSVAADQTVVFAGAVRGVLVEQAPWSERLDAHRVLADLVSDPIEAVRHQALAAAGADTRLACALVTAAARARRQGDPVRAAELGMLAAERTPPAEAQLILSRLVDAAEDAARASRLDLAKKATGLVLERNAPATVRARARLAVIEAAGQALSSYDETFAHAIADAAGDAALLARVYLRLSDKANLTDGDPVSGRQAAARAAELAALAGDPVTQVGALTQRARFERVMGDQAAEETLSRALELSVPVDAMRLRHSPLYVCARHALFDDHLAQARTDLLALLPVVERSGDTEDTLEVLRSLAELEARSGRCAAAAEYGHRVVSLTSRVGLSPGPAWYTAAVVEAAGGSFARAEAHALRGVRASKAEHDVVFLSRALFALGTIQLVLGRVTEAVATLNQVREMERKQKVGDPSVLRWHSELAEALIRNGDIALADALVHEARTAALELGRSGVLAALDRSAAFAAAETGDAEAAISLLEQSAAAFAELGLRIEYGRTLFMLGRVELRRRRRAAARDALAHAIEVLEESEARPWVRLVSESLARLDGSGPRKHSGLTEAEKKLVTLVARGVSNREAAATMFLSVKTVEAMLSRIYRNVGVRGRAELASWKALSEQPQPPPVEGNGPGPAGEIIRAGGKSRPDYHD
ncbi:AAA family ATPase [Streptomyces sp.]|uniref:AAA family ATPase n=1 Tax=Streptomyces sp. TaxID=1931 RepID=UPI002D782D08|nr:AAA family ATPase [Streptomyces sp.]HET6357962.1 AAA family ATPase [Streptomyces sp.]